MSGRLLSISAGTLRGIRPAEAAAVAAAAGFGALGVRFDIEPPTVGEIRALRGVLDETGLAVLDVEVVRIRPGDDADATKELAAWGAEVGARFLLVVSDDPDRGRTIERFAETTAVAAEVGMQTVLEFMRFTAVPTLEDALEIVLAAGSPATGVLVDPLHLARSGGSPAALAGVDPGLLPYAQLCDAPAIPTCGPDGLADEARHERLLPGDGQLPLAELLDVLAPGVPLSIEVLSDVADSRDRADVARDVMASTRALLATRARARQATRS